MLFIENVGRRGEIKSVSGTLRIDQREGLTAVVEEIQRGTVGAVLVVDVSRLFRDEDMVEPMTFAKLCKKYKVLIMTLDDTYNFNDERRSDLDRFYLEAKAAADFIKKHVRGKMLKGRMNKAKRGEHASGAPPVGFSVLSTISPGGVTKNLQYTPNPHAPHVEPIFQRFYDLGANFNKLYREVVGRVVFPDVDGWTPENRIALTRVDGGWTIKSRQGLKYILTNLTYIGHYCFDGQIMKENAHPAIVQEKLFWYAWEHLSEVNIEGNPIERPKKAVRYEQRGSVPDTMLLSGTRDDGRPTLDGVGGKRAYLQKYMNKEQKVIASYVLYDPQKVELRKPDVAINTAYLDRVVVKRLMERIEESHMYGAVGEWALRGGGVWAHEQDPKLHDVYAQAQTSNEETENTSTVSLLDRSIAETAQAIASNERKIRVAADVMDNAELRETYSALARLRKKHHDLTSKQKKEAEILEALQQAQEDLNNATDFASWDPERQRGVIRLVTDSITLEQVGAGWLKLTIRWCPYSGINSIDTAYLWRARSSSSWTEEEEEVLRKHYPTAPRMEIQKLLPGRSWKAIRAKAEEKAKQIRREVLGDRSPIPAHVSIYDLDMAQRLGIELDEPDKHLWWHISTVANGDTTLTHTHIAY